MSEKPQGSKKEEDMNKTDLSAVESIRASCSAVAIAWVGQYMRCGSQCCHILLACYHETPDVYLPRYPVPELYSDTGQIDVIEHSTFIAQHQRTI